MAIPPVVVDFRVAGIAQVNRAFSTVEQSSIRAEAARTKAVEKGEKERAKLEAKAERDRDRSIAAMAKRVDRSLAAETKAVEKAEKEKQRQVDQSARYMARVRENSATMAGREARKQADLEIRELKRTNDARRNFYKATGSAAYNSAAGIVGTGVSMAAGALSLGGGYAVSSTIRQRIAAEQSAAALVNAVTANGKAPEGADVKNILSKTAGMSNATGMSREEIIAGGLAYARSARGGNFSGIIGDKGNLEFFAKLAKTTGTSIEDIGQAAGTLQSQNAHLGENPALMRQMLLNAYAQSKSGSVSLTEAAKQFGTLGSTRGFFQGNEAQNQSTLIGLGQIAAAGGESGDIGTYIKDVSMEAAAHRHAKGKFIGLENMGVKFNKTGQMESPEQMIGAVMKATGGDLGKIGDIFGKRGMPLFSELQKPFLQAGGGDKGVAAVMEKIHGVTGSSMSEEDLNKQFAQTMSTDGEKMHVALMKIESTIDAKLAPALERFADKVSDPAFLEQITRLINGVEKVADFFIDNPFAGIGGVVLAKVSADMGKAAIGEYIKLLIKNSFNGGGTSGALASATGAPAGSSKLGRNLAAAGAIAAVAVVAEQAGEAGIDAMMHNKIAGRGKIQSLITQVKTGQMTPEAAQKLVDRAKVESGGTVMGSIAGSQLLGAGSLIGMVTGNKDNFAARAATHQSEAAQIANSKALADAIKQALVDGAKAAAPQIAANMKGDADHPSRSQSLASVTRGGVQ